MFPNPTPINHALGLGTLVLLDKRVLSESGWVVYLLALETTTVEDEVLQIAKALNVVRVASLFALQVIVDILHALIKWAASPTVLSTAACLGRYAQRNDPSRTLRMSSARAGCGRNLCHPKVPTLHDPPPAGTESSPMP